MDDLYAILEVPEDASSDTIRSAYKRLAKQYHPDRNPNDSKAEEKFKAISAAYDVLRDPKSRSAYDQQRLASHHTVRWPNDDMAFSFHATGFDLNDLFRDFEQRFSDHIRPRKNRDVNINYQISLEEAFQGKEAEIRYIIPGNDRRSVKVRIPPGIAHGQKLRYSGQGDDRDSRIQPGDLYVTVMVAPHATFSRTGSDLQTRITLDAIDAMLGSDVTLLGLDGKSLKVHIPGGTQHGQIIRVRGHGMPIIHTAERGDLLIEILVTVPKNLSEQQRHLLKKFREATVTIHE